MLSSLRQGRTWRVASGSTWRKENYREGGRFLVLYHVDEIDSLKNNRCHHKLNILGLSAPLEPSFMQVTRS